MNQMMNVRPQFHTPQANKRSHGMNQAQWSTPQPPGFNNMPPQVQLLSISMFYNYVNYFLECMAARPAKWKL